MSPGRSASTTGATSAPARAWSRLMRGRRIPCWPYAYWTSPEQSKPLSAVPPQTYGVPSDSRAVCTTSTAFPVIVVGGAAGGSSGGAPASPRPLPRSPLPNPIEIPSAALTPLRAVLQAVAQLAPRCEPCERAPLHSAAHAPLGGELLTASIGGQAEGDAGEGVGTEARPPAPPLDLVAHAVKGTTVTQGVVHEHGDPEPLREGRPRTETGIGPEFVGVRAVAVVPPADVKLQASPLGGERRRREREQQQCDALSPPRQRRLAPATGAAPCDGRGGAAP